MRTTTICSFTARTASGPRPNCSTTRGEKFSSMTSHVASSRNAMSSPSVVDRSTVRSRLFVLAPQKSGDHSHHPSSVIGRIEFIRMPSGFFGPST